jgi:choline dehydrogenase
VRRQDAVTTQTTAGVSPAAKPRVITNSLSEPDDLRSLVDGMQLAREIATQGPMREIIVSELRPGPEQRDRTDLEADLRRRLMLIYHPVSTCRMSDWGRCERACQL